MIPELLSVLSWRDAFLQAGSADRVFVLSEREEEKRLRSAIPPGSAFRRVALWVGPEGGFSAEEAREMALAGFVAVSLGGRILRTETAALAGIALLQHLLGDLG